MQKTKSVFWILLAASMAVLIPLLFIPIINYGQLGKQTFAAEMIQSLFRGEVVDHLFPIRHFLESNHNDLIPWAEEFPLYNWAVILLAKITTLNLVIAGKLVSFSAFIAIIIGFFKIGKQISKEEDSITPWIFASVAVVFPAFRLYSTEVMPDLWMTAFCVFAIERALADKPKTSALMIAIASLLKYYAVFTGFGIGLYYLYRFIKTKQIKPVINAFWLVLAVIPCVAYIAYFMHLQIPNPITEYRASDGHGHLSSLEGVLQFKKWARAFLWVFVKNSTLFGTALAAVGLHYYRKSLHPLFITLIIGWLLFPATFIESFYVHDYYGLQATIGVALFAALGLNSLRKNEKVVIGCLYIFVIWSIIHVRGMNRPIKDYDQILFDYPSIAKLMTYEPKWGFAISGISKPVIPFIVGQNAWVAAFEEMDRKVTLDRLMDSRIDMVSIHNYLKMDDDTEKAIKTVNDTGLYEKVFDQRYTESRFVAFKRKVHTPIKTN